MSKRAKPKGKKVRPTFWVFCEGETEKNYVLFLRSLFRIPIEVIPKVSGTSISSNFIKNSKSGKMALKGDIDFLMYDGDVPAVLEKVLAITNAVHLISTPSIELWFIYHFTTQHAHINESDSNRKLTELLGRSYIKPFLSNELKKRLDHNMNDAIERARISNAFNNPSSTVYLLLERLKNV
ncbi:RloB domain-containing protein [bacterium]|nr:MAG: RloB domain-containing protein [bacterium]